jgi:hypothetical protein
MLAESLRPAVPLQDRHRAGESPDPGEQEVAGPAQLERVTRHLRFDADTPERTDDRTDVPGLVPDDVDRHGLS